MQAEKPRHQRLLRTYKKPIKKTKFHERAVKGKIICKNRYALLPVEETEKITTAKKIDKQEIDRETVSPRKTRSHKKLMTIRTEQINTTCDVNLTVPVHMLPTGTSVEALYDPGSNFTIVKDTLINGHYEITPFNRRIKGISSGYLNVLGKIKNLNFKIKNKKFSIPARVISNMDKDLILGCDFMLKYKVILDGEKGVIKINDDTIQINKKWIEMIKNDEKIAEIENSHLIAEQNFDILPKATIKLPLKHKKMNVHNTNNLLQKGIHIENYENLNEIWITNRTNRTQTIYKNQKIGEICKNENVCTICTDAKTPKIAINNRKFTGKEDLKDKNGELFVINKDLDINQRRKALETINKYYNFFTAKVTDIGKVHTKPYKIKLTDNEPVTCKPYPLAIAERPRAQKLLQDFEKAGIIQPSISPYLTPAFIKIKENGEGRLLMNYKELNKKIVMDNNSPPKIQTLIEALQGANYFCQMDLLSSFYQFELHPDSYACTAFRLDGTRHYEYKRAPMGMKISTSILARAVQETLQNEILNGCTAYADDICVYGKTFDECRKNLDTVLHKLATKNFRVNTSKCSFFVRKINLFGFEIENNEVRPSTKKVKAILDLKAPNTVKGVRGLIGKFTYFRPYLSNFTKIAEPIQKLLLGKTKGNEKITWTEEQTKAFEQLKKLIASNIVTKIFDPERETFLQVDASANAIGAMLSQRDPNDDKIYPVAYYSEAIKPTKRHKCSGDLELIGLSKALVHFRKYLFMKKFTVLTDHKNLTRNTITASAKTLQLSRVKRITDILNTFDFDIQHIKGSENLIPDLLSRPISEKINNTKEENEGQPFIRAQEKDHELKILRDLIKNGKTTIKITDDEKKKLSRKTRRFAINSKDVLCYKKFNKGKLIHLPVIPAELQPKFLQETHEGPGKGNHMGTERCYAKLNNKIYWQGMYENIKNYVKTCELCQKIKKPTVSYGKIEDKIFKNTKIFNRLQMDILGPFKFPNTAKDLHIITLIDDFSKFIILKPVHVVNSSIVINFLDEIFSIFPTPKTIFCDNATYFSSTEIRAHLELRGIDLKHSLPYAPQTNGLIERQNIPIATALKAHLMESAGGISDAVKHVKMIQRAYNTCPHPLLEYKSPHFIVFGEEDRYLQNKFKIEEDEKETREEILEKVIKFREKIPKILHTAFTKYQKYHNLKHKNIVINEGDKVLIRNPIYRNKLQAPFIGPYEVLKKLSPVTLVVKTEKGEEFVHISRIKKYYERKSK